MTDKNRIKPVNRFWLPRTRIREPKPQLVTRFPEILNKRTKEKTVEQITGGQDPGTVIHFPNLVDETCVPQSTGLNTKRHTEERTNNTLKTKSLPQSTAKETADLPECVLQNFATKCSTSFQELFQNLAANLTDTAEKIVERVFNELTFELTHPGRHTKFKAEKSTDKERLHNLTNKLAFQYLMSRLEVISTARETVEKILDKWQANASDLYESLCEGRLVVRPSKISLDYQTNLQEMYKATLLTAMESVLKSSEDIAMLMLPHLESFANKIHRSSFKGKTSYPVAESSKQLFTTNNIDLGKSIFTTLQKVTRSRTDSVFLKLTKNPPPGPQRDHLFLLSYAKDITNQIIKAAKTKLSIKLQLEFTIFYYFRH
ncbi:uncharacterized protein LOC142097997 [Mixophyes fleayi]|uniref:uncharacterized protein LOC142097997 n=1 Tax=Mixophyes fleayi TaxID=3061075 RepID=UPI003F4DFB8E